ncbi:Uncharacterized [Syntrophomonas zehnderi OL-4]|uniref:Uncharacterized n=1 Tax=Syntrophomonas zehnderi OL-4 TaxID=690567 RepID=A0A0E4C9Q3_9FIRM|nr:hypothetical protein [Syntrophomonas zehnderi]CFY07432.1 Uncharacterized [Syntrophomonas zehnderi OL-4]
MTIINPATNEDISMSCYSFYSTILAFGLSEQQINMLHEIVKNRKTNDQVVHMEKEIRIYVADDVSDIYTVPYFMAFINKNALTEKDLQMLIGFWQECAEPLPVALLEAGYKETDFSEPVYYLFNSEKTILPKIRGVHQFAGEAVFDRDQLYLNVLSEIKNNEGLGRKASESSIRIYRVLLMYKCLLQEGKLTKQRADELTYPDVVGKRMFYRDIAIINSIEDGKVVFDHTLKAYVLRD